MSHEKLYLGYLYTFSRATIFDNAITKYMLVKNGEIPTKTFRKIVVVDKIFQTDLCQIEICLLTLRTIYINLKRNCIINKKKKKIKIKNVLKMF